MRLSDRLAKEAKLEGLPFYLRSYQVIVPWIGFPDCYRESFVNCAFKEGGGPCVNPKHQKSGPLVEGIIEEPAKKPKVFRGNPRKKFVPEEAK